MARGRLISLWRRWSQLTAGLSTAARKREMTNQPKKVRTCQRRNRAPTTTAVVSKAAATVRTTCEVGAPAHPTSFLGDPDALGGVGVVLGFACGSACEPLGVAFPLFISLAPAVHARVRLFGCAEAIDNRRAHVPGFFYLLLCSCSCRRSCSVHVGYRTVGYSIFAHLQISPSAHPE